MLNYQRVYFKKTWRCGKSTIKLEDFPKPSIFHSYVSVLAYGKIM
jgi:hypothetical protein